MDGFSIETHQYQNGRKPAWIMPIFGGWASCDAIDGSRGASSLIVHNVDGSCVSGYDSRMQRDLVPIPPKPEVVYWSKWKDVDPLIDRVRNTGSIVQVGFPVVGWVETGLHVMRAWLNDPKVDSELVPFADLIRYEYRRIGCPIWRPCSNTTTSEGV